MTTQQQRDLIEAVLEICGQPETTRTLSNQQADQLVEMAIQADKASQAQQVPQESEPSFVSDNRSLADIGNELHNLAVALHYNGREGDSGEIREIAIELWEREKSHPQPAQHVPEGWIKCSDRSPDIEGYYDAWSPEQGRRPDAYWSGESWADDYDGVPLQGVTHYCIPTIPADLLTSPDSEAE